MKKEKTILILFIAPLFLSTSFLHIDQKKYKLTSHEVEFTFTGNVALYGTPKDCGIFSPDTVTLKGILSGDEKVDKYDNVLYTGVLHLKINMSVCNVKRKNNGEDQWCIMNVKGEGPVMTELEIDTAAGYGYIKINYDPTDPKFRSLFGTFSKNVHGTCDPQEMKEEEDDNVPNNSIATIFNGHELRSLKNSPVLRVNDPKKPYTDSGPDGKITINVKN